MHNGKGCRQLMTCWFIFVTLVGLTMTCGLGYVLYRILIHFQIM